jgi:hypothetical protein
MVVDIPTYTQIVLCIVGGRPTAAGRTCRVLLESTSIAQNILRKEVAKRALRADCIVCNFPRCFDRGSESRRKAGFGC